MKTEVVKIGDVKLDPNNLRKHGEANLEAIKASLSRFGQHRAAVVQRSTGIVLIGNGMIQAARDLGWTEIAVHFVDDDDTEAAMRAYADNRTGELAEWVEGYEDVVSTFDDEFLEGMDFNVSGADFDLDDVVEDEAPEVPEEPVTQLGDVIRLGEHTLICGDATKLVSPLNEVACVFSDPPYGINYQDVKKNHKKIANDATDPAPLVTDALTNIHLPKGTPIYLCCDWRSLESMRQVLRNLDQPEKAVIVWDKVNPAQNLDRYFKRHELILYAGPYGGQKTLRGDVWEFKRKPSDLHPTMKPVALVAQAIQDSTKPGDTVFDPFLGSGTTLIAAEQLGRVCIGIELDPAYCDVIVQRWETLTGEKATREAPA